LKTRTIIAALLFTITTSTASLHWGIPLLIAGLAFAFPTMSRSDHD
jgi:hypothetical protein